MIRPSVAIQSHPDRAEMAAALAEQIPGAEVVVDPKPDELPNPWRTYQLALDSTPAWASHRLVLQDDAEISSSFPAALEAAIAARPDRVLVLFHGGAPRENLPHLNRALTRHEVWAPLRSSRWVPVVAVVWPARLVCPAVCWVHEQGWPERFRADDEIVGRILRAHDEQALACVPSIVQHPDLVPSLIGRKARAGKDAARVAHCWIGDADPLALAWDTGAA